MEQLHERKNAILERPKIEGTHAVAAIESSLASGEFGVIT
jgi:hypothetical protein